MAWKWSMSSTLCEVTNQWLNFSQASLYLSLGKVLHHTVTLEWWDQRGDDSNLYCTFYPSQFLHDKFSRGPRITNSQFTHGPNRAYSSTSSCLYSTYSQAFSRANQKVGPSLSLLDVRIWKVESDLDLANLYSVSHRFIGYLFGLTHGRYRVGLELANTYIRRCNAA